MNRVLKQSLSAMFVMMTVTHQVSASSSSTASCSFNLGFKVNGVVSSSADPSTPKELNVTYDGDYEVFTGSKKAVRRHVKRLLSQHASDCATHWMSKVVIEVLYGATPNLYYEGVHCGDFDETQLSGSFVDNFTSYGSLSSYAMVSLGMTTLSTPLPNGRRAAWGAMVNVRDIFSNFCTNSYGQDVDVEFVMQNVSQDDECNHGNDLDPVPFTLACSYVPNIGYRAADVSDNISKLYGQNW